MSSLGSWLVSSGVDDRARGGHEVRRAWDQHSGIAWFGLARRRVEGLSAGHLCPGRTAGQPKRWHPAAQARTYFGTAIHAALIMRDALPGTQIALALPDAPSCPRWSSWPFAFC